ncbi:MAG TPA: cellulose biosynthesis protein BcsS, partial [Rhizobiales bacterium]|nr:cellulose biosynthesis protein BcsS [Hyphomicrobiales bacterium]
MKRGFRAVSVKAVQAAILAIGGAGFTALAPGGALAGPDNAVNDTVIYWSGDLALRGSGKYSLAFDGGFATALDGDIGTSGWIVTADLGYSHSKYVSSKSDSFYTSLLFGHQWQSPDYYFSLSAGLLFNSNDEKPSGGKTDGDKVGGALLYGFETKAVDAFYVQSYGSFSTVYDQVYLHGKAGYKTATFTYGAEYTFYDDNDSKPTHQIGAF